MNDGTFQVLHRSLIFGTDCGLLCITLNFKSFTVCYSTEKLQQPPIWCQLDTCIKYLLWKVAYVTILHAPLDTERVILE